jgi:hypothetical protein
VCNKAVRPQAVAVFARVRQKVVLVLLWPELVQVTVVFNVVLLHLVAAEVGLLLSTLVSVKVVAFGLVHDKTTKKSLSEVIDKHVELAVELIQRSWAHIMLREVLASLTLTSISSHVSCHSYRRCCIPNLPHRYWNTAKRCCMQVTFNTGFGDGVLHCQ